MGEQEEEEGARAEPFILILAVVIFLIGLVVVLSVLGGGQNIVFELGRKMRDAIFSLLKGYPPGVP